MDQRGPIIQLNIANSNVTPQQANCQTWAAASAGING
jgi:hypothetical protein